MPSPDWSLHLQNCDVGTAWETHSADTAPLLIQPHLPQCLKHKAPEAFWALSWMSSELLVTMLVWASWEDRLSIKLQMSNPTQVHNLLFLHNLQSKQAHVSDTAAIVKQHKIPGPKEHIFYCFLCVPPSFWHRHHPSDVFKGQAHHFKNTHVLPFLSSCTNTLQHTWQEYFENLKKHLLHLLQYLQRLVWFLQNKELFAKNPSFHFGTPSAYTELFK